MRVDHLWIYMYEVLQNRSRVSRERLSGLTRLSIVGCVNPFLKINPCFRSKSVWARFYTERNVSGYTVFRGFSWLEGRYYRSRVNRHFPTRELIYRFLRDRFEKNNTITICKIISSAHPLYQSPLIASSRNFPTITLYCPLPCIRDRRVGETICYSVHTVMASHRYARLWCDDIRSIKINQI